MKEIINKYVEKLRKEETDEYVIGKLQVFLSNLLEDSDTGIAILMIINEELNKK